MGEMQSEVLVYLGGESLYPKTKDSVLVKLLRGAGLLALASVLFWCTVATAILPFFLLTGPALVVVNAPSCVFGGGDMLFAPVPCALSACTLGCGLAGLASLPGVIAFSRLLPMIPKERLQFSTTYAYNLKTVKSSGLVVRETAKRLATQRMLARHLGSGPGHVVFSYLYFPEAAPLYGSSSRERGRFREYFRRRINLATGALRHVGRATCSSIWHRNAVTQIDLAPEIVL